MLVAAGCAWSPVARSDRLAAAAGAERVTVSGTVYRHVVYRRLPAGEVRDLHVYVGGDGRAFLSRTRVSREPTAGRPLGLQLMLDDPAPAIYLARPCYHGTAGDPACSPRAWTTARFSAEVVASMSAALSRLLAEHPQANVTLIGYSGGGVVALLMAARLPRAAAVVTLAAPLDVAEWARRHDYSPLRGSLNPADVSVWPASLRQIHVHGADDDNVAPDMLRRFIGRSGDAATFVVLDGFDHVCCWRERWPGLLRELLDGRKAGAAEAKL